MANNQYVDDLRSDALWRAGEPQDSSSSFWTKSLEYLNRIQQTLMLGGKVAVGRDLAASAGIYAHLVDIPMTDWWWARKQPRGVLTTLADIETGTVTLTQGSTTVTFSSAPAQSVASWRIQVQRLPTVPRILAHTAGSTTATLDDVWPEPTQTGVAYACFKLEYALAPDFLRFAGAPFMHSMFLTPIPVGVREGHDQQYPLSSLYRQPPTAACLIAPQTVQFNAFDTRGYRMEYDYIFMPPDLQAGGVTILPPHHRSVLASGAAMLMSFDKSDGRTQNLASEFRELVAAMKEEQARMLGGGSMNMGQFKCRPGGARSQRSPQPNGEWFLR